LYEQKIKAGLVYNLLKYTTWPAIEVSASEKSTKEKSVINVCIFGADPFDGYLAPLEGRTANQAIISILHVTQIPQLDGCHALIIHRSEEKQLADLVQSLNGKNILTISDVAQFSKRGGMVELAKEGEKIALFVNNKTVFNAGLVIEEPMLRLAKVVGN
ncbi:MAG: YfiR family protein, partial [Chitinophagaceae bacterium]